MQKNRFFKKLLVSGGLKKRSKYSYLFFNMGVVDDKGTYNMLNVLIKESFCVYVRKSVFNTLEIDLKGYIGRTMEKFDKYSICEEGECPVGHYVFTLETRDNLYKTGQLTLFPQEPFGRTEDGQYLTVWDNLGQPQCYKSYTYEEVKADELCLDFDIDGKVFYIGN